MDTTANTNISYISVSKFYIVLFPCNLNFQLQCSNYHLPLKCIIIIIFIIICTRMRVCMHTHTHTFIHNYSITSKKLESLNLPTNTILLMQIFSTHCIFGGVSSEYDCIFPFHSFLCFTIYQQYAYFLLSTCLVHPGILACVWMLTIAVLMSFHITLRLPLFCQLLSQSCCFYFHVP